LEDVVLENLKSVLREVGDQMAAVVGDGHVERDFARVGGEDRCRGGVFGSGGWWSGLFLSEQRRRKNHECGDCGVWVAHGLDRAVPV
jgi:hypothetical protein